MSNLTAADIASLQNQVLWGVFAIALLLGALMQRSNFCTMGAVSDIVNIGDWTRMRMWMMAVAVAILATQGMVAAGWIDTGKSVYTTGKLTWLSHLVGGTLFGLGMVLASGCGSKTLVRLGGGSVKSLVVFIVLGLAAFMTMRGVFAVARVASIDTLILDLGTGQDLPTLLGMTGASARLLIAAIIAVPLIAFSLAGAQFRREGNWLYSTLVGLAIAGAWYLSGKIGYIAEDPETLQERFLATNSGRPESFTFVAPIAYTLDLLMMWSDKSKTVSLGIAATLGMIAGAWISALASGQFRWEGFQGTEDTANHLAGAALMGIGGVTALGCTIGQGLSGVSTLALGSFITVAGIMLGALLGFRYQTWRIEKSEL